MKKILYNSDNLKEEEINRIVLRAKTLIVNSNDEILLAHCHKNYYFPGGHVEENESFDECIVREIKEETGVDIPLENRIPFLEITYMVKDYPNLGINTKTIANYYVVKMDLKPDMNNTNLTKEEKEGNFELRYIHKDKVVEELKNSLNECTRVNPVKDTIKVIEEYIKNNNQ